MAESSSGAEKKLSRLIEGIVQSAQTETICRRAEQIRHAIELHLRLWLDEVENQNPLFKVSELIQVGSYAEGTKIVYPNEFDFLAVIDDLSQPGSVIIDNSASDLQQGLVRIAVADELKSRWSNLCKNGHLQCFKRVNFPNVGEERFGHFVISVLNKKVKEFKRKNPCSSKVSFGSPFDLTCDILLPAEDNIPLFLKGVEYLTPNVLIQFEFEGKEITVDLSPAIRYHKTEDCFIVEDCTGPAFAELVLSRKSLLLVGAKSDYDFKVTVTEAEVQYMQSVMKSRHKLVYIFLKYVTKLYADEIMAFTSFTSYMLKTVCIHHDIKCKSEGGTIAACLKAVIEDLEECTEQDVVHSIVSRHLSLYFHPNIYGPSEWTEANRRSMLDGMRKICRLSTEVNTVEQFNAFIKHLVLQEKQKRYEDKRREEELRRKIIQQMEEENHETLDTNVVSDTSSDVAEIQQLDENAVLQIIEMGFEPEEVHEAMRANQNDLNKAVDYLLNDGTKSVEKEQASEESQPSDERTENATAVGSFNADSGETSFTTSQSSSSGQNSTTCNLLCLPSPNEEPLLSSTNEKDLASCVILYQRQKNI